jgi:peptide/nickel transport system permease protein
VLSDLLTKSLGWGWDGRGVLIFNGDLHWLPASGDVGVQNAPTGPTGMVVLDSLLHGDWSIMWDAIQHLILPAFCVGIGPAVSIAGCSAGRCTRP